MWAASDCPLVKENMFIKTSSLLWMSSLIPSFLQISLALFPKLVLFGVALCPCRCELFHHPWPTVPHPSFTSNTVLSSPRFISPFFDCMDTGLWLCRILSTVVLWFLHISLQQLRLSSALLQFCPVFCDLRKGLFPWTHCRLPEHCPQLQVKPK